MYACPGRRIKTDLILTRVLKEKEKENKDLERYNQIH